MTIFPLRAFINDDIEAVADIYYQAASEIGKAHYSPEQIAVWANYPRENIEAFEDLLCQGDTLVAVDHHNRPVAFGQLHPTDHLTLLYVLPEYSRRGLGKKICTALEAIARSRGQKSLSVTASKVSKNLFLLLGFELVEEEISVRNSIPFERYNMVKKL